MNEIAGRQALYFLQSVFPLLPFHHISIISSIILSDFAIPSFGGAEQLVQLGGVGPTRWDTPFGGTKYFPSYVRLLPFPIPSFGGAEQLGGVRLSIWWNKRMPNQKIQNYTKLNLVFSKTYPDLWKTIS